MHTPRLCNKHRKEYKLTAEGKATAAAWSCVRCHTKHCACYPSFRKGHCGKCCNEMDAENSTRKPAA